jgi:hypothetical protein
MTFQYAITSLTLASVVLIATACSKPSDTTNTGPVNSIAYYSANAGEAKQVAEKCKAFEVNAYSTMSSNKQKEWQETPAGINCKNARQAYGTILWNEHQQRITDSANKYGK